MWKNKVQNQAAINRLKKRTIIEHAHHEAEELKKELEEKAKEIFDYFND